MKNSTKIRLVEFFIIGIFFGVIEDVIAITVATNGHFELRYLWVSIIVALPFAIISELVVDHPSFWKNKLPKHWFAQDNSSNSTTKL